MHAFHALNVGLRTDVWFEYVASKANIADLPSRMDFDLLKSLSAQERQCVLPSTEDWLQPDVDRGAAILRGEREGQHKKAPCA